MLAACEVDVYGAATMVALYAAGLGMTPPDFVDWTDLHPTEPNVWLAWHCGNAAKKSSRSSKGSGRTYSRSC
jgi:L-fucose isomerase-like protein